MSEQTVLLRALGNIGYADAWDLQEQLLAGNVQVKTDWHRQPPGQRIPANAPSTQHHLLLCEHPLVYTLGKSGKMQHVLLDEQSMAARGISFFIQIVAGISPSMDQGNGWAIRSSTWNDSGPTSAGTSEA